MPYARRYLRRPRARRARPYRQKMADLERAIAWRNYLWYNQPSRRAVPSVPAAAGGVAKAKRKPRPRPDKMEREHRPQKRDPPPYVEEVEDDDEPSGWWRYGEQVWRAAKPRMIEYGTRFVRRQAERAIRGAVQQMYLPNIQGPAPRLEL